MQFTFRGNFDSAPDGYAEALNYTTPAGIRQVAQEIIDERK